MPKSSQILHPIESLGVKRVSRGEIRVEKLSERLQPRVDFPHRHDFFQITFVTKGKGWHEIDFKKHTVNGRGLFFMKPGQVHSWQFNRGTRGFVIEFTNDSLSTRSKSAGSLIAQFASLSDTLKFKNPILWLELESVCKIMEREFSQKASRSDTALEGFLTGLLVLLSRADGEKEIISTNTVVDRFQSLVASSFQKEHGVSYYARELNMTPKALTMKISRALGKSPRDVIQERFVLEAKRLLAYSELSVAEIGYELGFDDANYFTRFFRKYTKISPSQFRSRSKVSLGA